MHPNVPGDWSREEANRRSRTEDKDAAAVRWPIARATKPGEWTGWVNFEFPFNQLIKLHGISRFHLIASQPEVKLYLSPINFDPRSLPPGFKISSPTRWALR